MCFELITYYRCNCTRSIVSYCATHVEYTRQQIGQLSCAFYEQSSQVNPDFAFKRCVDVVNDGNYRPTNKCKGKHYWKHDFNNMHVDVKKAWDERNERIERTMDERMKGETEAAAIKALADTGMGSYKRYNNSDHHEPRVKKRRQRRQPIEPYAIANFAEQLQTLDVRDEETQMDVDNFKKYLQKERDAELVAQLNNDVDTLKMKMEEMKMEEMKMDKSAQGDFANVKRKRDLSHFDTIADLFVANEDYDNDEDQGCSNYSADRDINKVKQTMKVKKSKLKKPKNIKNKDVNYNNDNNNENIKLEQDKM